MTYQASGGLILAVVLLTVLVAIPMKLGAKLVNAKYAGIIRCGFAAFVGLMAGLLASFILGGTIGIPLAAALGFVLAIRAMLGTSFLGAIGLTLVALLISVLGFWCLVKLGVIVAGPLTSGVAI